MTVDKPLLQLLSYSSEFGEVVNHKSYSNMINKVYSYRVLQSFTDLTWDIAILVMLFEETCQNDNAAGGNVTCVSVYMYSTNMKI